MQEVLNVMTLSTGKWDNDSTIRESVFELAASLISRAGEKLHNGEPLHLIDDIESILPKLRDYHDMLVALRYAAQIMYLHSCG